MDCRQASQAHTLCVYEEATLLEVVQNEIRHRPTAINTDLPGKDSGKKLPHPPLHQWSLQTIEVVHAVDTDAPPYHHRRSPNLNHRVKYV